MKRNKIFTFVIFLVVALFLVFAVKGQKGNPIYYQTEKDINVGGPFELSNSASRYALIEAIVENNTFFFNTDQAKFSGGDLVYYKGKFFSVFTPGVSIAGVPFYIVGKIVGVPQLFTFLSTLLFAIINFYLIVIIGKKLGAHKYTAYIGAVIFLFGTSAFPYALSLTQHHISTMCILLGIIFAFSNRTFINNLLLGIVFGIGILMDIPNAFMMAPIIFYVLYRSFALNDSANKLKISLQINILGLLIGVLPFVGGYALYNHITTGSYTRMSQSIGRVDIDDKGKLAKRATENAVQKTFEHHEVFDPRKQLNGLYILLISDERGWIYYSPIVIVGLLGLILSFKKKENKALVILSASVISVCVICYSMFGDPWGGWAFGPRYLIPATAIVCSAIGYVITRYKKNPFFIIIFLLLTVYSISVNSLGALTTSAIPPKVEAINLPNPIPYTYKYNIKLIEENKASSLVYNLLFYQYTSFQIFTIVFISSELLFIAMLYMLSLDVRKGKS